MWGTLSKVLDRSKKTQQISLPPSRARCHACVAASKAPVVDFPRENPPFIGRAGFKYIGLNLFLQKFAQN